MNTAERIEALDSLTNQLIAETGCSYEDAKAQIAEVTADETDEQVFARLTTPAQKHLIVVSLIDNDAAMFPVLRDDQGNPCFAFVAPKGPCYVYVTLHDDGTYTVDQIDRS